MKELRAPLLLPTIAFVVGCVVAHRFGVATLSCTVTLLILGVLYALRRWSSLIILMALCVGGVRGSLFDGERYYYYSAENSINEAAQLRVESLNLSARAETLTKAMVLGDRDDITYEQRLQYGRSGASHILAVSGLHLSIIFIFINIILLPILLLRYGHIIRNILVVVLIWGYAYVVGMGPSVVRGAIMFSVVQGAWALGRHYGGLNVLMFAIIVVTIFAPTMLYNIGFQLSAIAIAAIYLWALPLYYRLFGGGGFIISALCIGVACSVATLPLVSYIFGYIPVLGVGFSPLFIATSSVIIICGAIWIVLPAEIFSPIIRFVVESMAMIQERTVEWIAGVEWGYIEWRIDEVQMLIIYLIYATLTLIIYTHLESEQQPRS